LVPKYLGEICAPERKNTVVRVLVCIPHFFRRASPDSGVANGSNFDSMEIRASQVSYSLKQIHAILGPVQFTLGTKGRIGNEILEAIPQTTQGDVIIVSVPGENLIDELSDGGKLHARLWSGPPRQLGYRCRHIFARNVGKYDLYCFIEDDTAVTDPAFFRKIAKFYRTHGEDKVLMPNRYEIFGYPARGWRTYIGHPGFRSLRTPERPGPETLTLQDFDGEVLFEKTRDSQAGAYVITDAQLRSWMKRPGFQAPTERQTYAKFDPMELAMIPMGGRLPIYRPAMGHLDFLQVHHVPSLTCNRKTPREKLVEYLDPMLQKEWDVWVKKAPLPSKERGH
jgi:hypothetical protein